MTTTLQNPDAAGVGQRSGHPIGRHLPGESGVWIIILGEMLVFATLFALYAGYRLQDPAAFRSGQDQLSLPLGTINTVLLLVSSLLVVAGTRAVQLRVRSVGEWSFAGAALCGVGFTAIKYIEYSGHLAHHHTLASGNFWTYYYVLTGTHLLHLLIGLCVLGFLIVQARKSKVDREHLAYVEGGACYWHMVDLIWLILFPLLYLVR